MPYAEGDPSPSNTWWNTVLRRAKRGKLVSAAGGLELSAGGLARVGSPQIWALVSGTGPAYGFQEATPGLSGTFDLVAGGRTDVGGLQPAYEVNGGSGSPTGFERLWFSAAGDWRFQDVRQHGDHSPYYGLVVHTVCNFPSGIVVTVDGSDGYHETRTSPSAYVWGDLLPGVTYTVTGNAGLRMTAVSASFTAGDTGGSFMTGFALLERFICPCATGYTAVPGSQQVMETDGLPISNQWTYTDSSGTFTLNYSAGSYDSPNPCSWNNDDGMGGAISVYYDSVNSLASGWYYSHVSAEGFTIADGRVATFHAPRNPDDLDGPAELFSQDGVSCVEVFS